MRYTSLALFFFLAGSPAQAQPAVSSGTWTADIRADRVYLELRTSLGNRDGSDRPSSNGQSVAPGELAGLPAGGQSLSAGNVTFELRREAGTFVFDGAFRRGQGAGLFIFTPRVEYAAELKALGYSVDLPLWRQFQLAFRDVGPRYIRALKSEGFDTLTFDDIERGRNHGVTIEYIATLKARGYRGLAWDTLVRTRDHGVTASFIEGLEEAGFKDLPLDQLVRAKDHGVSPEYIADMKELGFADLTLTELVRLRDHGVTPGFVNHIRARGYKDSTVEEVIRLKDRGLWRE